MPFFAKGMSVLRILQVFAALTAMVVGAGLGITIAASANFRLAGTGAQTRTALPSQILDRHGRLITEFFSDEKRQLLAIGELPKHLIFALITREDNDFFQHNGFSLRGTVRAAWNLATQNYSSGGSSVTQQLAGTMFSDRTQITIRRKLEELWFAFQLERSWTKNEILEEYLNRMWFGHNTYGVEAASQFFFGKSAREITVAESAMLVIQLANPNIYSPIRRPNEARRRQRQVLDQMVERGYIGVGDANIAFDYYWENYDFTRTNTATAFFEREDRAPYFSEYVRELLETEVLLGSLDIYRDGFTIHTTLDLDYQAHADRLMRQGIDGANTTFQASSSRRAAVAEEQFVPVIDLLSLVFDMPEIRVADAKQLEGARTYFRSVLNPVVDMVSLMFGYDNEDELRHASRSAYQEADRIARRTTVEGALIALENQTGHIVAMVGGSQFERTNQFNRALQAQVQPGSAFKPLYYAAAIEEHAITPTTMIYDAPVAFVNEDGTPYTPLNYRGEWQGPVLARHALATSMNIPSLRVLSRVGFTDAFYYAGRLLNIPDDELEARGFVRRYPVGLGIVSVAPIQMAQAFATFPNEGRTVTPVAIRYVEDRTGRIIAEPERELREQQARSAADQQIISPQAAYLMVDMLQSTVTSGTLRYATSVAGGFSQPTGGKTGTTQNWSDVWTVGFTPYYTTAVWMGFDQGGNTSLGIDQTGAITAGPVWARFMKAIHENLPVRSFNRPSSGLSEVVVTARSGLLPPVDYAGRTITGLFIAGTEPQEFDRIEQFERDRNELLLTRLSNNLSWSGIPQTADVEPMQLALNLDLSLPVDFGSPPVDSAVDSNVPTWQPIDTPGPVDTDNWLLDPPPTEAEGAESGNPLLD